jgi:AmiR/NasT family two-component response regulator
MNLGLSHKAGHQAVTVVPRDSNFSGTAQVHQAIGMILVQAGVDGETATQMLVDRAHDTGRSMQDVANDVVEGRLGFDNPQEVRPPAGQ